jgi:hypothetical protein
MEINRNYGELDSFTVSLSKDYRHSDEQFLKFLKSGNIYFNLIHATTGKHVIGKEWANYVGKDGNKYKFFFNFEGFDVPVGSYNGYFIVEFPFKDEMLIFKRGTFTLPLTITEVIQINIT